MPESIQNDNRYISPKSLAKLKKTILDLFAKNSYEDIGIREICSKAKVSATTVYKYFGSKDDLLYACIKDDMKDALLLAVNKASDYESPSERLQFFATYYLNYYFENKILARAVYLNLPSKEWVKGGRFEQSFAKDYIHSVLQEIEPGPKILDTMNRELFVEMILGAGHRVIVHWLVAGAKKEEGQYYLDNYLAFIRSLMD